MSTAEDRRTCLDVRYAAFASRPDLYAEAADGKQSFRPFTCALDHDAIRTLGERLACGCKKQKGGRVCADDGVVITRVPDFCQFAVTDVADPALSVNLETARRLDCAGRGAQPRQQLPHHADEEWAEIRADLR